MAVGALPYFLAYLTPLSVVLGLERGGWSSFETVAWVYVLIPAIDALVGVDRCNLGRPEAAARERSIAYSLPLWLYAPTQLALIVWVLDKVAEGSLRPMEIAGLTVSTGIAAGAIGIVVAHELMHRRSRGERLLAWILMASVGYGHFCIEHVRGHHRRVATPHDPATARRGESFYAFWPRCVWGSLRSAWRLECERLARRGAARWGTGNEMLRLAFLQVALYGLVGLVFGGLGLAVFVALGVIAFSLLEIINYIEHYGLERREIAPGRYEPVGPEHSWNASHRITNWFLFELARHPDHHLNAGRRYPALRHLEASPQLPVGYAAISLLALVPPLWRRVMDPRVAAWRAGQATA